ncbi:MAG: GerAB/ArcD/ProY family transporter [Bacillota bacterium]
MRIPWQISALQAAMLVAGSVSLTGHALAVTFFLQAGGRDSWMSGLISLPIAAVAIWSMVKLSHLYPGKSLVEYLPSVLGFAGYPLAGLYLLYYLTTVIFTLRMTTDWLVDSVLMQTPSWVLGLTYMLSILYCAVQGLDVVARVNQFTLPLLSGLGVLVALGTAKAKDYSLLMPFFEFGLGPVLSATFLGLGYFGEMSILLMMGGYVNPKERPRLVRNSLIALLFVVITLTGPLAGSIATLGYRAAEQMPYPTFTHWMLVSLARFFERTDLLAVHQWLAGAYVRCALFLLLAVKGGTQLFRVKKPSNISLLVVGLLAVAGAELLFPHKPYFDEFIRTVYLPAGAFLGILLPPVLLMVAVVRGASRPSQGVGGHGA